MFAAPPPPPPRSNYEGVPAVGGSCIILLPPRTGRPSSLCFLFFFLSFRLQPLLRHTRRPTRGTDTESSAARARTHSSLPAGGLSIYSWQQKQTEKTTTPRERAGNNRTMITNILNIIVIRYFTIALYQLGRERITYTNHNDVIQLRSIARMPTDARALFRERHRSSHRLQGKYILLRPTNRATAKQIQRRTSREEYNLDRHCRRRKQHRFGRDYVMGGPE